ncbi:hypothetical protein ERO13_D13G139150v2 [Gossypium hirsutum]|uniref:Uncharacterized protein n=3 Tax=Gossypium TaxID=3633 RepID=A0A5J5NMU8_GOSBA|nr:hypothetical protein ES319_D13G158400v1 [Gossypium barbadense]KAG4112048.1 hypothetical protein ERO13_D13G139150v2 [Gossypium hirsutum]TYG37792.1 hypothetical protein ES288_D13G169700v1 [Gossypium darwinii]TYH35089.1 hypothetical protein ES332_D13G169300v1 [Gossypium tomentosum]
MELLRRLPKARDPVIERSSSHPKSNDLLPTTLSFQDSTYVGEGLTTIPQLESLTTPLIVYTSILLDLTFSVVRSSFEDTPPSSSTIVVVIQYVFLIEINLSRN